MPTEFLLRVRPLPEGGYQATCQPVDATPIKGATKVKDWLAVDYAGDEHEGQGVTALAAMFAALVDSQVTVIETQVSE
jgi:hypothetical protein